MNHFSSNYLGLIFLDIAFQTCVAATRLDRPVLCVAIVPGPAVLRRTKGLSLIQRTVDPVPLLPPVPAVRPVVVLPLAAALHPENLVGCHPGFAGFQNPGSDHLLIHSFLDRRRIVARLLRRPVAAAVVLILVVLQPVLY